MFPYLPYISLLLTLWLFTPFSSADFDLYVVRGGTLSNDSWVDFNAGWMVESHDHPSCDDIDVEDTIDRSGWLERDALLGEYTGVRCAPKESCGVNSPYVNPWPIFTSLKMHFTNSWHWDITVYNSTGKLYNSTDPSQNSTWIIPMFTVDGYSYGTCHVDHNHEFGFCPGRKDANGVLWGQRKFRCWTDITADELKAERRNQTGKSGESALQVFKWPISGG